MERRPAAAPHHHLGPDGRVGALVHAADLHLGAPLHSLGTRLGEERAAGLRRDAALAFDELIDLTLRVDADVLVLAGDIYDQAEFEVGAQLRLARGLRRLTEAGVRVFMAHGNHDPLLSTFRPATSLPDEVVVFAPGEPQVHRLQLRSGHTLDVVGVSFDRQHEPTNLARRFADLPLDPRRTVAVLHTNVGSDPDHGDYAPCTVDDLAAASVGYWALGHIHLRQVHPLGPGRWWAYPGNLQGRSTKASECGPKGAIVVPILPDGFGEPEFHPCDRIRFARLDIDVSTARDLGEALELTAVGLGEAAASADGRPLVARVRLTGPTAAHGQLRDREDLVELLQEHGTSATVGAVEVATRPLVPRAQLLERDDLLADLLRAFDTIDDAEASVLEHLGDELPSTARRQLAEELHQPDRASALLGEVEQLLIDLLGDSA